LLFVLLIAVVLASAFAGYIYYNHVASLKENQPLTGTILWHGSKDLPEIALTFDDGPNSKYTPKILDILRDNDVKATFFVLGKFIENNKDILTREADEGHIIGNHTFTHAKGTITDIKKINRELVKTDKLITEFSGENVKYFRPPFGFENWRFLTEAELMDYTVVLWSLDVGDWNKKKTEKEITSKIFKLAKNGSIILLHDGGTSREAVINSLPVIIKGLKSRGYKFVTIDEMIAHRTQPRSNFLDFRSTSK
jgi:peptidoglycan/xylan/chitin deacetylase (PgdA/CDA1 family)